MPRKKGHRKARASTKAKKKPRGRGRRYTQVEKERILAVARQEGLSGAQVNRRFGISTLTFYKWRGPVERGRRSAASAGQVNSGEVREATRKALAKIMPQIVQEEVAAYLAGLTRPRRGRPRKIL